MTSPYPAVWEHLMAGVLGDLVTGPVRLMMVTDAYVPDDTDAWASVPAAFETFAAGYVTGGPLLPGRAVQITASGVLLVCSPVVFDDTGLSARWGVVYVDTGDLSSSPLIGRIDLGQTVEPDGGDLTVGFPSGVLLLGPTP